MFKPKGYNSVSPYLIVNDGENFIKMMEAIFDATIPRIYKREDGSIKHGEVKLDDSIIMFSQSTLEFPTYQLYMHIYVPDVIKTFEKAIKFGCKIDREPIQNENEPDMRGSFIDSDGINWSLATEQ